MASKPKNINTYIVVGNKTSGSHPTPVGRFKVGARDEKEAIELVKAKYGLTKYKILYKQEKDELAHGVVIKETIGAKVKILDLEH